MRPGSGGWGCMDLRGGPLALALIFLPSMAAGDAIVRGDAMRATTIVEFFIDEDEILVELEIGAADLAGFRDLMPDGIYERMGHAPRPQTERILEFFATGLPILGPDGEPLTGHVLEIDLVLAHGLRISRSNQSMSGVHNFPPCWPSLLWEALSGVQSLPSSDAAWAALSAPSGMSG